MGRREVRWGGEMGEGGGDGREVEMGRREVRWGGGR